MDDELNRLERLSRLRDSGALTEEEFQARKAQLFAVPAATPPLAPLSSPAVTGAPAGGAAVPWLWIVGGVAALAIVLLVAVLVGRDAVGDGANLSVGNDTAVTVNLTEPVPAVAPLPAVTVADNRLMVGGRPSQPAVEGNNGLEIVRTFSLADRDLYVVQDDGGTGCPTLFYIAEVTATGFRATDEFGSCGPLIGLAERDGVVTLTASGFAGPSESDDDRRAAGREVHSYRYADGKVRETGARPRGLRRPEMPVEADPADGDDAGGGDVGGAGPPDGA